MYIELAPNILIYGNQKYAFMPYHSYFIIFIFVVPVTLKCTVA